MRKEICSALILVALTLPVWAGGKKDAAPVQSADGATRAIRTNGNVLPVPAGAVAKAGDQERFDSFVWSVDKLKSQYNSVIVLDARDEGEYKKGHLPGAVRAAWQEWSNMAVKQDSGEWGVIQNNEKLSEYFGSLGIDGTKPVVIYTDSVAGWGEEGRQLWTFRVFGLNNTYLLNGGIHAWEASGGEITKDAAKTTPVRGPSPNPNMGLCASTQDVVNGLGAVNVLDVREDQEYAGAINYGEASKGRIPGAKHIWFKDFYTPDGFFLSPAQVRARLQAVGFEPDTPVVTYCTGGIRSGLAAIMVLAAGYDNACNYNGSFSAWAGTKQQIDQEVYKTLQTVDNLN
ncbi:sulfurtransferase [Spirochaetia bacterium]|nr:sulfurtransferase [Spirochaetia bacterium]